MPSSWKAVADRAATDPRFVCIEASTDVLDGIIDEDIVLLATAATLLRPHACHSFAAALLHTGAIGAYSDHDRIDPAGTRHAPVFKPAMSPVFMRQVPYAGPVIALRLMPSSREALTNALSGPGIATELGRI